MKAVFKGMTYVTCSDPIPSSPKQRMPECQHKSPAIICHMEMHTYIYKHNILLHTVCCGNFKPSSTKQDSFTRIGWKMCSCGSSFGGCFRGILRDLQKKQKTIVTLQFNLRMLLLNSFTNNKIQCFARKARKSPRNSPDHQRYFFQGILTHLGMKIAAKN